MSFYLILDRAKIHRKFDVLGAEIRFYSFVNAGQLSLPGLDALMGTEDVTELRDRVRRMGREVLARWESIRVDHVRAGHTFLFGDTGRVLYRSDAIPTSLDWIMLVIEDDRDVRNLGSRIDELLPDDTVDQLAGHMRTFKGATQTPAAMAGVALSKALIRGVTHVLKGNGNDQIGVVEQSFVRELHYPDGKRMAKEVQDLSGNMWYDYTIFGTVE